MRPTRWIVATLLALDVVGPGGSAWAQSESQITLPRLGSTEWLILWAVLGSALVALAYGYYLVRKVLRQESGPAEMVAVSAAIE
jgi:hypothetical protein